MSGGGRGGGGSVEADEVARARGRVGEDLGDLEGVRLDVLGEPRPGEREIVAHQVVNREARYESCEDNNAATPFNVSFSPPSM